MNTEVLFDLNVKKINGVFSLFTEEKGGAKRKNRSCWALIFKYEGETVYTCNGKKHISNLENMVILPRGSSYEWQCTKAGRYYAIEFDCDLTCDSIFSFPIENGEKILQIYRETEYKQTLKRDVAKLEAVRNVYSILLLLLQDKHQKYSPSEKQRKITPALEYISNNYHLPITNDDLAAHTGLSTIYFRKLFREVLGVSPIYYVHKLRIKKAKEMLKSDHPSLAVIATELGYANGSDFSKAFKKHTGFSPLNYLKQKKLSIDKQ